MQRLHLCALHVCDALYFHACNAKVTIYTITQSGNTALIGAGYGGHEDCVRLLVDAGADKEAKDDVRVTGFFIMGIYIYMTIYCALVLCC